MAQTQTQTYLAQVDRFRFKGGRLLLVASKRPDGLWLPVPSINAIAIPLPSAYANLHEHQLVLLELNLKQEIVSLKAALPELLRCLKDWSLRIAKFDSQSAENELSKAQLSEQGQQFFARNEEMRRRENFLAQREKQAEKLIKVVTENNLALERERAALEEAWGQIANERYAIKQAWQQIRDQETAIASALERIRNKENAR